MKATDADESKHGRNSNRRNRSRNNAHEKQPAGLFERFADSIEDLLFIIAATALNGLSEADIQRNASELTQRFLDGLPQPDESEGVRPLFRMSSTTSDLLACAQVQRFRSPPPGASEAPPSERLRFVSQSAADEILLYAWRELKSPSDWREHFLGWVASLGFASNLELRVAAGRTASLLAHLDFDIVRTGLLLPWFGAKRSGPLDAIDSLMTSIVIKDQTWAKWVDGFLGEWASGKYGVHGLIAARVLAEGAYGRTSPDAAFRTMGTMFRQKRRIAFECAAGAYITWFSTGPANAARTLDEIMKLPVSRYDEIAESSQDLIVVGLLALSRVKSTKQDLPILLGATSTSDYANSVAANLICNAIKRSQSSKALYELRKLFENSLRKPPTIRPTHRLLQAIFNSGSHEEQEDFLYHLRDWADEATERGNRLPSLFHSLV